MAKTGAVRTSSASLRLVPGQVTEHTKPLLSGVCPGT